MVSKSLSDRKQSSHKLVIGLTGGIGSGKSTVAEFFTRLGIQVFDADLIAREIIAPDSPALTEIITYFGQEIVDTQGLLKRASLRQIIFSDSKAKLWLENLIHPLVRARMQELVLQASSAYCILMIPLLLEGPPNPLVQRILVVDTPEELQLKRAQQRDKTTKEHIQQIMQTQVARIKRLSSADDVISNDAGLNKLQAQVANLHVKYMNLATTMV